MMILMTYRIGLGQPGMTSCLAALGRKLLALALTLSILLLLPLFVQAAEALQAPRFAYGANASDWSLSQYLVDPRSGKLSHNGNLATGVYPVAVTVHPSGRFVLSAAMTDDTISVYRIDARSGRLTEIPQSPFATGARAPFSFSIHPSGRFVYVSARVGRIVAFAFDADSGVLTPVPGSPFTSQRRTRSVKVHPSGRFLYAANAYDNSVTAYAIDETSGALTPLSGSPYDTGEPGDLSIEALKTVDAPPEAGGIPYTVAIHPSGRFLYVSNWMGASLSLFAIDSHSGVLQPLPGNPMRTGGRPFAVTVHPSGRFVYVNSWDAQAIYGYAVDENSGQLTELPDSPFYTPADNPIDLTFNATGTLAYVTQSGSNAIELLAVDTATGALHPRQTLRTRYEPFDIALLEGEPAQPAPRFAYGADAHQHQLRVYGVGVEGGLTAQAELGIAQQPTAVVVGPRGRYLYVASADEPAGETADKIPSAGEKPASASKGRLAIYSIDPANGALHLLQTPYRLGLTPTALALDVSGHFLYAVDPQVDGLLVFAVNADSGLLSRLPEPPPRTGKGPVALALDPAGRFSFVANAGDNTVSVFTHRREGTAAIFPIYHTESKYAVGSNPRALTVDPTGNFLLVANAGDNSLSMFNIHFHQGLLKLVDGAPYPTGTAPVAMAVHPNGQWVFVVNRDSGDISRFRLDDQGGHLVALPGRIKAGPRPVAITLAPGGRFAYVRDAKQPGLRRYSVNASNGELKADGQVDAGALVGLTLDRVIR